jgi:hypothetical protein
MTYSYYGKRQESKVNPMLNNQALYYEDIWWSGDIAPQFLTSALDGGEQSASHLGCFTPRERAPGSHWIEDWVGPIVGRPEKNFFTLPEIDPRLSSL